MKPKKDVFKEIENEKEIVRRICMGLAHPDQSNQREFTKWLQDTVIFHLEDLSKRLSK